MTKIKICGLTRNEDIEFVNEAKPDYIGFVFAKSKRQVSLEKAREMKNLLSKEIRAVGVFVNEDIDFIKQLYNEGIIDIAQLHGDETEEYIKELSFIPTIKVIRVKEKIWDIKTYADYILFDTYHEKIYGGIGRSFNWDLIDNYKGQFFLAGGIDIKNVIDAIETTNPFCIDISSGVETDGKKDKLKILEMVKTIRNK